MDIDSIILKFLIGVLVLCFVFLFIKGTQCISRNEKSINDMDNDIKRVLDVLEKLKNKK